ncbi:hypothetical protein QBC34DRAFT_376537 [Podospora aff. communis PSN243]|uniref:DUF1279 domain-containing protein n=1 Tax=Podospora aff. communis PSN243 TaxID=3040156 RepID=A0AAV9GXB0_9PEZI|nr:hypothetical protein QBC34DRAFT_376537 [Podospora aff. communis PSN243]
MPTRLLSRLATRSKPKPKLSLPHRPQTRVASNEISAKTSQSRADRILSRLPRPLQKYTSRLRNAPLSHVVAFLILHEITAVVPLLALFGIFHYTEAIPVGYVVERYGGWVAEGAGRGERYFRRKGWFGFSREEGEGEEGKIEGKGGEKIEGNGGDNEVLRKWEGGDGRYRVVVEVALAYALTKAMLPLRIMGSLWATPWFAGVLGRLRGVLRR